MSTLLLEVVMMAASVVVSAREGMAEHPRDCVIFTSAGVSLAVLVLQRVRLRDEAAARARRG